MDSQFVGTWKRTLEIQGSRRPPEHVLPAGACRSAEIDYCTDGWKDARQQNEARVLPETKEDLVHHIMNVDEIESE
jgi:hypothetical protein